MVGTFREPVFLVSVLFPVFLVIHFKNMNSIAISSVVPEIENEIKNKLQSNYFSISHANSGIKLDVNSEFTIILSVFASPKVNFPDKVISSATIRLCDICNDPDILTIDPV